MGYVMLSSLTKSIASCLRSLTAMASTVKFFCLYSLEFFHGRHFFAAGHAPGGPEIEQHHFAAKILEGKLLALRRHQGEIRRRRIVLHGLKYRHRLVIDFF